jgi:hypothetical protein
MLNKRGHIGTTLLVFVAFILIVVTLFVFVSFDNEVGRRGQLVREIHSGYDYEGRYLEKDLRVFIKSAILDLKESENFKEDFLIALKKFAGEKDRGNSGNNFRTNLYGRIINVGKVEEVGTGIYDLVIEGVFIEKKTEAVVLKTTFDLRVRFDMGKIISFEKVSK